MNRFFLKTSLKFLPTTKKVKDYREISLGFSPNIGMKREIFRDTILLGIIAAGFSTNDFTLQSSPKITVYRSSQVLSQDLMREAVEKAVLANFKSDKIETKITKLQLPEKIILPKGNVEVFAAPMSGVRNFLAPFTVLLEIKVDGKTKHRTSANVEIETYAEVLIMNKSLTANEKITEKDVHKAKIRLEKPIDNYLLETDNLRGKKLIKNIAENEPLLKISIIPDSVIRVGDSVKIVGQAGKMQIIVLGEARANGRIGERIPVKNTQSGIILQATVVEEGLVKVKF
ncbi:MAG: flagellar basal body P-ring formation protein FlgA [Blastocatellia bacterium]|nr:flagellar basal body P-ring formation protein FlgA [Blastocatellia bacterium]